MKYKVGDKVRVRTDLERGKRYGDDTFIDSMSDFRGKEVEILRVSQVGKGVKYTISGCMWNWTDEMLEPVEERRRVEVEEKYINDLMGKIETLEKEIKELKGEELLPCPFCGGDASFVSGTFAVSHDPNCYLVLQHQNAVSKINSTPKQCVEAWNRRV